MSLANWVPIPILTRLAARRPRKGRLTALRLAQAPHETLVSC